MYIYLFQSLIVIILQQIFNVVETYIYSYTHIILENIKKKIKEKKTIMKDDVMKEGKKKKE